VRTFADGEIAYVYLPADAAFPTPCMVLSWNEQHVQVAVGRTRAEAMDIRRDNVHLVDASQVTTEPPQLGLFGEVAA